MQQTFKKKLMRHFGPTRPDRILHEKLHTMFHWHVVPFQHINETTVSHFLLVFPNRCAGRGASSCTVANWQPSTDSSPFPLDLELLSHALPLPPPFSFSPSPFLLPLFDRILHGGNRTETTPLFLPRYERWHGGGTHWSVRRHHLG